MYYFSTPQVITHSHDCLSFSPSFSLSQSPRLGSLSQQWLLPGEWKRHHTVSVGMHRGDFTPEHMPHGVKNFRARAKLMPRERVSERGKKDAIMLFSQAFD